MARRLRLKPLAWTLGVVLCLLVLLPAAGTTLLLTSANARLWAVHKGVEQLQHRGVALSLDGLTWPTLGELHFERLSFDAQDNTVVTVQHFTLRWQPQRLWQRQILINAITASALAVNLSADEPTEQPTEAPQGELSLPNVWPVEIERFAIDKLTIRNRSAAWNLPSYRLHGNALVFTHEPPLALNVSAVSLNDNGGEPTRLNISTELVGNREVTVHGAFFEPAAGRVGELLRLPAKQPVDAAFAVNVKPMADQWQLSIERLQMPFLSHQLRVQGAAQFNVDARWVKVPELVIEVDDKVQRLRGGATADDAWFDAEFSQLPLELANPWLPQPVQGIITAKVRGDWRFATQRLPELSFEVATEAHLAGNDLTLTSQGAVRDDVIYFEKLSLSQANTRVTASGLVAPFGEQTALNVRFTHLHSELLKPWVAAWPDYLSFAVETGQLLLKGPLQAPSLEITTKGEVGLEQERFEVTVAGTATRHAATFAQLAIEQGKHRLRAKGSVNWQQQTLALNVQAAHLTHALVSRLDVADALSLPEGLTFDVSGEVAAQGAWQAPAVDADLAAHGSYAYEGGTLPYRLTLKGHGEGRSLTRYRVDIANADLEINDRTVLEAWGKASRNDVDLTLTLNHLPVEILAAVGFSQISGEAEGQLRLRGTPESPQLDGELFYRNPSKQLELTLNLATVAQELSARFGVARANQPVGELTLAVPLHTYLQQGEAPIQAWPLNFRGEGELDLALVQLLLNPDIHQLDGKLALDLTIDGTVAAPQVRGYVRTRETTYHNRLTNTHLAEIKMELVGSNDVLELKELTATDEFGGTVTATGTAQLAASYRDQPNMLQFQIRAQEATLAATEMVSGQLSATVKVNGHLDELWVTGKGELSPLNISIAQAFTSSIPTIQYAAINQQQATHNFMPVVHLDVVLDVDKQAFVRGRGLETEIRGNMRLSGTLDDLSYRGQFSTRRGHMDLFNKRFTLQEGSVQISNEVISLLIEAAYQAEDVEYLVELSGTTEQPKLNLSSIPAMPEDEILARLIFGKSIRNISAFQAIQIALAVQTLAKGGSGFDPLEKTRQLLGVDTLTIDNEKTDNGDSGLALGIGKYVSERVFVEVKHTPDPAEPWQGRVEIELTPSISVQTSTATAGGGRAEILWKKDY